MSLEALKSFFSEGNTGPGAKVKEDKQKPISPILTGHIEREKQSRELLFYLADNIKKSEQLRIKINKDFIAGVPREAILKDCLECISLMTGDKVFYNQNIKYIKDRA